MYSIGKHSPDVGSVISIIPGETASRSSFPSSRRFPSSLVGFADWKLIKNYALLNEKNAQFLDALRLAL